MSVLKFFKPFIAFVLLVPVIGCETTSPGTYIGGVLLQPSSLDIKDHYAFSLVDKWRIGFSWISGPVDINYCDFSHRYSKRGEHRFFEKNGILVKEFIAGGKDDYGKKIIASRSEAIYGENSSTGKFDNYRAFCTHTFQDIWTGISVFLVKPDPAKGTDEWVDGATTVTVNGLHWLRKDTPIEDYSRNPKKWAASIEDWVLKIPDTPYWFIIRLGGSSGGAGTAPGINRNPEKYALVLDLFHQMIESVKLEPIAPTDINKTVKPEP